MIGLSLMLLMIVFRSIAVPIKATLGYLLSVGAALGAVVAGLPVGLAGRADAGRREGPIVSFLPIFVMGVLFGLAMDYEMFLVSAMREHYVHTGDPREAVPGGFQRLRPGGHGRRAHHDQRLRGLHPARHETSSRSRSVWRSASSSTRSSSG